MTDGSQSSGSSGGRRRGSGRGRGSGGGSGSSGSGAQGGRQHRGGRGSGPQGPPPLEVAARSTRNALTRHASSIRDDQSQLAARAVLVALGGAMSRTSSPAEALAMVEQTVHVLEAGRREEDQLPVALRAVVAFTLETPRRSRDIAEMLRLLLRHGYSLAADHIPRELRDDGSFRASALRTVVEELAVEYMDDAAFAKATPGRG